LGDAVEFEIEEDLETDIIESEGEPEGLLCGVKGVLIFALEV